MCAACKIYVNSSQANAPEPVVAMPVHDKSVLQFGNVPSNCYVIRLFFAQLRVYNLA